MSFSALTPQFTDDSVASFGESHKEESGPNMTMAVMKQDSYAIPNADNDERTDWIKRAAHYLQAVCTYKKIQQSFVEEGKTYTLQDIEEGTIITVHSWFVKSGVIGEEEYPLAVISFKEENNVCLELPPSFTHKLKGRELPLLLVHTGYMVHRDGSKGFHAEFIDIPKLRCINIDLVKCDRCHSVWDGNAQCDCYWYSPYSPAWQ